MKVQHGGEPIARRVARSSSKKKPRKLIITANRFRLIAFLVTMTVAGLAIAIGETDSAVVWAFLSLIVGQLLGQKQSE